METVLKTTTRQRTILSVIQAARKIGANLLRLFIKVVASAMAFLLLLAGALFCILSRPYWPMALGLLAMGAAIALAWWLSRPFAIVLAVITLVGTVSATVSQRQAFTQPITDGHGNVAPGSITSLEKVRLGGIDQWIVIRGRDRTKPVLLYLEGGPGASELAGFRKEMGGLEDHFVVVDWQQRGAGKSASVFFGDYAHMTPRQYVKDGLELTSYLRQRFHQDKIYLLGQSWGSLLGIWMVQERPEWFHAYIGVGQVTQWVGVEQLEYAYTLRIAREKGDTRTAQRLESYGPPPYQGFDLLTKEGDFQAMNAIYMKQLVNASDPSRAKPPVSMWDATEYGIADKIATVGVFPFTFITLYDQLLAVDLTTQANHLEVPVYFAAGRWDINSPTVLAEAYYQVLEAPSKEFRWFERAGHGVMVNEPEAFIDYMVNTVLAQTFQK